jgi:hypothetical protein
MLNSQLARILVVLVLISAVLAIWYLFVPRTLLYISGNGQQPSPIVNSKHFTTHGNWSVTYTYTPVSNSDNECNFGYAVINSNGYAGKNETLVVLGSGGTHTKHYHDSARHYIQILPSCPWSLVVKGSRIEL